MATPNDSRYIPFTQQAYCCVPTSIQMIMYRHNIPLMPVEELGHHLGLTVSPDNSHLFHAVRVSDKPPTGAGFGSQVSKPEFEPNKVFQKLDIPLRFDVTLAGAINGADDLLQRLVNVEKKNMDALLGLNHGLIRGQYEAHTGHVVVFDRVIDGQVRVINASRFSPKWQLINPDTLYEAIQLFGDEELGGIWHFTRTH